MSKRVIARYAKEMEEDGERGIPQISEDTLTGDRETRGTTFTEEEQRE
jgi:hypothetical protein